MVSIGREKDSNGSTMGSGGRGHVVLFTLPVPGHYHPFVQLLYLLNANCPGLMVTITVGSKFSDGLAKLHSEGEFNNIDLRIVKVLGEVPPYLQDPKFPVRAALCCAKQINETEQLRNSLKESMGTPEAPTAIIADMFLPWTKDFADELGVPWYVYYSGNTMWTHLILEYPKPVKAGIDSRNISKETDDFLLTKVPDFERTSAFSAVRAGDIPIEYFDFPEFYLAIKTNSMKADGVLQNTAEELDGSNGLIPATKKLLGPGKYLCIGPSIQMKGFGTIYSSTDLGRAGPWLESQQEKSVLFVAFGSLGTVPKESILELAKGLEASGVPFLWALKGADKQVSDVLPEGFEERTKDRGHIETGWVAQTSILKHPAVGGFLSHCGWNSIMESICAGVPVIAWPLSADQYLGGRYIHEVAKVGMTVSYFKDDYKCSYDDITGKAVANAVMALMLENKGRERRENMDALQKQSAAAVIKGGSSYQNLQTLFSQIYSAPKEPVEIAEVLQ